MSMKRGSTMKIWVCLGYIMCVFASRKLALNMWKLDTDMRAISTGTECIYTKGRQLYSWRYWSKVFSDFFGGWRCQLPESCFTWWRYSWWICWWCWSLNSGGVLAGEFKWFIALHPWVMMIPYNQADQICNDSGFKVNGVMGASWGTIGQLVPKRL